MTSLFVACVGIIISLFASTVAVLVSLVRSLLLLFRVGIISTLFASTVAVLVSLVRSLVRSLLLLSASRHSLQEFLSPWVLSVRPIIVSHPPK